MSLLRSDFVRKVGSFLATQVVLAGLATIAAIIIARILGPEGRGQVVIVVTFAATIAQLGNLGLHAANSYYVARDPKLLPALIGNTIFLGLFFTLIVCPTLWLAFYLRPGWSILDNPVLLLLALAGIPLQLVSMLLLRLHIGQQDIKGYNRIQLGTQLVGLALLVGMILLKQVTPALVVMASLAPPAITIGWSLVRLSRPLTVAPWPSGTLLPKLMGYGLKAYLAGMAMFLVIRFDLLMLARMKGDHEVGLYSVAVSITDMMQMIPVAIGTILFPKLTAMQDDSERWLHGRKVVYITAGITSILGAAFIMGAPQIIYLLFGDKFAEAAPALVALIPGIVCLSINIIFMNFFASTGMPLVTVWSPSLAAGLNILLNLWAIPRYGIVGAAWASTFSYGLMLLISMIYVGYMPIHARSRTTHGAT